VTSLSSTGRRVLETVRGSGPLWTASLILDRVVPSGILRWWPDRRIAAEVLTAQIEAILRAWGMSPEHVAITVEHMLYADLRGIDSHGCSMLLHYHRGVVAGSLTMTPTITVVREGPTTALIDGGGGLGHVPADVAMKLAIAKCRETGVAAVAVRNSGHYGAAGAYVSMAVAAGFIGIATTATREPAVVPTFGIEAKLGTNPIAFAAPAASHQPFVLDMATSTASLGAIMMAWRTGQVIPTGWALDAQGEAMTNGRLAAAGRRLTPLGSRREMGSHKGYGLAAMVEILSSILPGGRRADAGAAGAVGHFCLALDPQRFRDAGQFEADLDVLLDSLRACPPQDRRQPVLVAGDPERAAHVERRRSGIPLSRSVIEDIRAVARASGVAFLLDRGAVEKAGRRS
jgi:LDH2 family malate/lactate/ureidoglycolate dehydrogenase